MEKLKNREKVKEALTDQMRMWKDGKIKTDNGTIGVLEQKGLTNEGLAESLVELVETVSNEN